MVAISEPHPDYHEWKKFIKVPVEDELSMAPFFVKQESYGGNSICHEITITVNNICEKLEFQRVNDSLAITKSFVVGSGPLYVDFSPFELNGLKENCSVT